MRKLLILSLLLFAAYFTEAQTVVPVALPTYFLKWIKVKDSVRASIYLQNPNDTLATRAYARGFAGGSLTGGIGIKVSGNTISIDTLHYRKQDSLWVTTDSTFIVKINGVLYPMKMRGAVFAWNDRTGNVKPQDNDYAAFYPKLDSLYNDPTFISHLSFSKMINLPNNLAGYNITDAVKNKGGGNSLASDVLSNRPAPGNLGSFFLAIDDSTLFYDNGTRWVQVSSAGTGGTDSAVIAGYGILKTVVGTTIKFTVDTTTLKSVFPGGPGGGINQIFTKYGLIIGGTDTATVDTALFARFKDTLTTIATRSFVNSRGFLTAETDPVATAKTITNTQGSGILITGTAGQTVGSNPTWTYKADTGLLATKFYVGNQGFLSTELDPVALAKTITNTQGSGILITGTAGQTLNSGPTWTFKADTGLLATKFYVGNQGFLSTELDPVASADSIKVIQASGILVTGLAGQILSSKPTWTLKADTSLLATNTFVNRQGFLKVESDPVAIAKTVTLTQGSGILITGTAGQTVGGNPSWTLKTDTGLMATQFYVNNQGFLKTGIIRIAPIDSLARVANGFQIAGNSIVGQTADLAHPGFISAINEGFVDSMRLGLKKSSITLGHPGAGLWGAYTNLNGDSLFIKNHNVTSGLTLISPSDSSLQFGIDFAVVAGVTSTQTLTNKTLTSPKLNSSSTLNYVWTSTGTDGSGAWAAPTGVGAQNLSQALSAFADTVKISGGTGFTLPGSTHSLAGLNTAANQTRTDSTVFVANTGHGMPLSRAPFTKDSLIIRGVTITGSNGLTATYTGNNDSVSFNVGTIMTTTGQLLYESSAGVASALNIGSSGQVLTVVAGVPAWQTITGTGSVTNFASTPTVGQLFTTSVTGASTSVVQTITLSNACAHCYFGNTTGSSAPGTYQTLNLTGSDFSNQGSSTTVLKGNVAGSLSWAAVNMPTDVTGLMNAAQMPALSGDISNVAGSLVTAIGAGKVTNTMLAGFIDASTKLTNAVPGANGGTGVNNSGKTITLGGNLQTMGAFNVALNFVGTSTVTFPTSGTLLTTTGSGSALTGIVASLTGTPNQVIVTPTGTSYVVSGPQNLGTANAPTFTSLNLTGLASGAGTDNIVTISGGSLRSTSFSSFLSSSVPNAFTGWQGLPTSTGQTTTAATSNLIFALTSTIATAKVLLPSNPPSGLEIQIHCSGVSAANQINAFTIDAQGFTIIGPTSGAGVTTITDTFTFGQTYKCVAENLGSGDITWYINKLTN